MMILFHAPINLILLGSKLYRTKYVALAAAAAELTEHASQMAL